MIKKIKYIILGAAIIALLLANMAYGITLPQRSSEKEDTSDEPTQVITAIEVSGNSIITEQKILESVFSKIGDTLIKEKVNNDLKAIYSAGYFQDISVSFSHL